MSEQKKYLFIESGSKYPYVCSNSEDVWNFIKSSNLLSDQRLHEIKVGDISFFDLPLAKDNITAHRILREIVDIIYPTLKILDCEVALIRQSTNEFEFRDNIRKYLNCE